MARILVAPQAPPSCFGRGERTQGKTASRVIQILYDITRYHTRPCEVHRAMFQESTCMSRGAERNLECRPLPGGWVGGWGSVRMPFWMAHWYDVSVIPRACYSRIPGRPQSPLQVPCLWGHSLGWCVLVHIRRRLGFMEEMRIDATIAKQLLPSVDGRGCRAASAAFLNGTDVACFLSPQCAALRRTSRRRCLGEAPPLRTGVQQGPV